MSDKEKEKPDWADIAVGYTNLTPTNWECSIQERCAVIYGCNHVWQTEVVKRDEEISRLHKLIHDHNKSSNITSKERHTPGPWKVRHSESKNAFNVVGTRIGLRYKIARCPYLVIEENTPGEWKQLNDREKAEAEANAKLIADAPEMQHTINQLREENETLKEQLSEEKRSTKLLHEGMKTDELRGVLKGREEIKRLIALAYAAGVAGVGWNEFQDKHNL